MKVKIGGDYMGSGEIGTLLAKVRFKKRTWAIVGLSTEYEPCAFLAVHVTKVKK